MIPNMAKIAGELTSATMHVSAEPSLPMHFPCLEIIAMSWQSGKRDGQLASNSVQEAHDLAVIATASTLKSRVPFLHFFDGFRTSHEISKIEYIDDDTLRQMIDFDLVLEHRKRALSPDRPFIRGTAQNPDVFFQSREGCNPYFMASQNRTGSDGSICEANWQAISLV